MNNGAGKILKCPEYSIVFEEVPDCCTLALNISGCCCNCDNCSEEYLKNFYGEDVTNEFLDNLIAKNPDVDCICLMGGDVNHDDCIRIFKYLKEKYPHLQRAIYSGFNFINLELAQYVDFYKYGRWIQPVGDSKDWWKRQCGPLCFTFSNQRMYRNMNGRLVDITYRFQDKPLNNLERYIIKPEENKDE